MSVCRVTSNFYLRQSWIGMKKRRPGVINSDIASDFLLCDGQWRLVLWRINCI